MSPMAGIPSWMQVPMAGQPELYSESPRIEMLTPIVMGDRCLQVHEPAAPDQATPAKLAKR